MPLLSLGFRFFINQILYLIVNETSLFIVVQFFGPEDVTVYNLAFRYITITSMGYIMILTPFLSAFTEAYVKKEYTWIKATMMRINLIWLFTSFVTILMIFGSNLFFKLWIHNAVTIPITLIVTMAVLNIVTTWSGTYSLFLNGIGKIRLQLYLQSIQALLFLPLSYFFYKLGLGLISIVIPQILLYSVIAYYMTIQYKKIINQTATGIWYR